MGIYINDSGSVYYGDKSAPHHPDATPQQVAAWAALAAQREAHRASIEQAKADTRADNFVQQFVNMTPAQLIAYVNANVSNLADAKQLLTKLALMLLAIAKEQYK